MVAANTGRGIASKTGVPNSNEYQIGGGKLYLADLLTDGQPGAFRFVGNVPTITLSEATETYAHMSSTVPVPVQDYSAITKITGSGKFSLEHMSAENMALFFLGDVAAYVNPAIAGLADVSMVAAGAGNLKVLSWYQVRNAAGHPVFGITSTNAIAIKTTNVSPKTLTKDTDYTVDAVSGMIFILSTADTLGAAAAGEGLTVTLTADAAATAVDQVSVLSDTSKKVAMRLISYNSADGNKITIFDFHKVSLAPDGDTNLITTEISPLPMSFGIEENAKYTNRVDIYTPTTQAA
jgi:hypothetical protein